jgi:hypothetical protein
MPLAASLTRFPHAHRRAAGRLRVVVALLAALGTAFGIATSPTMASPPGVPEPNLVVGDGRYGEVQRFEGSPTAISYGSIMAVDDLFLAIVGRRAGATNPRFIDVFRREASGWTLDATIEPTPASGFAAAVAIDGLRLAALTPNGVRVYLRGGAGWTIEAEVVLPGTISGSAIAMRGDTIAVGRPLVNGAAAAIGQVDIVTNGIGGWQLSASIANPTPVAGRRFGSALAFLDDDSLIISAPREDGSTTFSGALYRYSPAGPTWTLDATILPIGLTADARFGSSIATDGNRIAVGAPNDANLGTETGAVILLTPDGSGSPAGYAQTLLRSSVPGSGRKFGTSVAIHGSRLVVGSPMSITGFTGMAELFVSDRTGSWTAERLLLPAPWKVALTGNDAGTIDASRSIGELCLIDPFDGALIIGAPASVVDGISSRGFVYSLRDGLPDCNANGLPDLSEVIGSEVLTLGPVPFNGDISHSLVIPALPAPTGAIRITTYARTNGGVGTIFLNGIEIGSMQQNRQSGCAATWGPNQVLLPLDRYLSITGGESGILTFTHSGSGTCAPLADSYLRVEIRYPSAADASDLDVSLVPDTCQDCDGDGLVDVEAIAAGAVEDCNGNWVPDACEILEDCNDNGIADLCEIATGGASDCNDDGKVDACQIASGELSDCDGDGVPDLCGLLATDALSDDGELSVQIFGGVNSLRLQGLRTTDATETIFGASILWKVFPEQPLPPASLPITILLYEDPNQDGAPDDAVAVASLTTTLGTPGVGEFVHYALPPTFIGPAGTSFFIGAFTPINSSVLIGLDCEIREDALQPFIGGNLTGPAGDPVPPADLDPLPLSSFPASVWTIRGLGLNAFTCLVGSPADLDRDGTVGPLDLGILLGNWGGSGTGDLDGDGTVGAGDIAILLGAWSA